MERFYLNNAALFQTLVKRFTNALPEPKSQEEAVTPFGSDIVVTVRVRPLSDEDKAAGFPCAVYPRAGEPSVVDVHDLYNHPRGRPILKSTNYTLDHIFPSSTPTAHIYTTLLAPLLPALSAGQTATLFAYGQTSSGKTYTITGLQRLLAASLFPPSSSPSPPDGRSTRRIALTAIELAGAAAADLLAARAPVSIRDDADGETHLAGASEHVVTSADQMLALLERAAGLRATQATGRNEGSSRAHAVFRVRIRGAAQSQGDGDAEEGTLYLVDLAGSEAARDVATHGAERMRETREINLSLSVLEECIRGMADANAAAAEANGRVGKGRGKKAHIPFRRSVLTRVLRHVFEPGRGKVVVVACVNPGLADVGAGRNTLRFAELLRVGGVSSGGGGGGYEKRSGNEADAEATSEQLRIKNSEEIDGQRERWSSRELGPPELGLPFKERIRPGMVVSWVHQTGSDATSELLAIVLCPTEAAQQEIQDDRGGMLNSRKSEVADTQGLYDVERSTRYLCGLVLPTVIPRGYELNPWQQVVIDVGSMEREVILEYDPGSRYYFTVG